MELNSHTDGISENVMKTISREESVKKEWELVLQCSIHIDFHKVQMRI